MYNKGKKTLKGCDKVDDYERIQHAVRFMEENLQNELKVTDIASKACFSPFHFQRLFQAISGFSVQEYIRRRRLSEAAGLLKETGRSILDIAIDFQYGSQEAFSRAFANCFGITPGKYRKTNIDLNDQHEINFLDFKTSINEDESIPRPNIIQLDSIQIVGYEYHTDLNGERYFADIPGFYHDFGANEYYMQIPGKAAPDMSYGISCNFQDEGGFSFVVGEAVQKPTETIPESFVHLDIPGGTYAMFEVNGRTELVQNTRRYIYHTWLPNANYERREGPDFEVTDVRRSCFPDDMKMKIYIPIF